MPLENHRPALCVFRVGGRAIRMRLWRWALAAAFAYSAVLVACFVWHVRDQQAYTLELAKSHARTAWAKDVDYRRWSASHGGVYVPATEKTPPNPHLLMPERDIAAPSGRALTLVNPAYMTRQVHELAQERAGIIGHITSLKPLRPENAPDDWETAALQAFEQGQSEVSTRVEIAGAPHMRLMRPLVTEPSCLKCHASQGYKVGQIRGGISATIPMTPLLALSQVQARKVMIGYAAAWLLGVAGVALGTIVIRQRIRERDHAEKELRERENDLAITLNSIGDAVIATDVQGRISRMNPVAEVLTGWTAAEALGRPLAEIFQIINAHTREPVPDPVERALQTGEVVTLESDTALIARDGTQRQIADSAAPIRDAQGAIRGAVLVFHDVTSEFEARQALRTAARTDGLTGLPNRALFCDRLQQAILRARRLKNYHFAVLFLDFDRFKLINDSLGHAMGDLLLQAIASRLRKTVRAGDSLSREAREHTSARLGGDEFVVLLDGIDSPEDAKTVADRLLRSFAESYQIGKQEVYSTASIGIVTSDIAAETAEEVLRDADTAMYEAKLAGKGRYVVFDVSMRQRVQNRLNVENDLRKALEAGQFSLLYQPIVSLKTGQVVSFEALVRWQHPQRGLISPAEFVPIAEDTGLIVPLGEWVLRQACRQLAQWRRDHLEALQWSISVNLSRVQLLLASLPETIREVLEETHLPPSSLHLEITESAVMRDVEHATRILHEIKALHVKLALDDFGTGYSSLSCLHQFPLDVLKIDRSFVANIDRGRDFAALIHAVAQLASRLGIRVVAEGIETAEQLEVLQALNCEFGQGYRFAKPLDAPQAAKFALQPILLPGRTPAVCATLKQASD